ncbi:sulfite exporter TauE/SafE family protein [Ferrovibrio xuzhouensis]|uniref:Probable membrane transporter protein n=1 Tax=Ferrovibrio xuzhouensis TaxID=1576914 RepID=A0ABV7VCI9_9PROT
MQIYLPIAEMSVSLWLPLGLGAAVGYLSGLFGVGGGFLLTPLLIFIGVPPPVAVAASANQVVASSVSAVYAHWRKGNVDFKMGGVLLIGGLAGSAFGAYLFSVLKRIGQLDAVIALSYVVILGLIGSLMMTDSIRLFWRSRGGAVQPPMRRRRMHDHPWIRVLPFKLRFRKSQLYVSALLPVALGFVVGILAAIMGVGAGFMLVPAMIYLLGMPTAVVIGTSLVQIIFVTANVTMLHAISTQTVDLTLVLLLVMGSVVGAQYGVRHGARLRGEQIRGLLAAVVLAVAVVLATQLVIPPDDVYFLEAGSQR